MGFTNTIARTYNDGLSNIGGLESVTGDTTINFDGTCAGSATPNTEVDVAFTRANLKSLCLYSDKALTIWTNAATGAATDDIDLVAGQALVWSLASDGIGNCPFSANVTKLYVHVTGTATATLKVRAILDQTP